MTLITLFDLPSLTTKKTTKAIRAAPFRSTNSLVSRLEKEIRRRTVELSEGKDGIWNVVQTRTRPYVPGVDRNSTPIEQIQDDYRHLSMFFKTNKERRDMPAVSVYLTSLPNGSLRFSSRARERHDSSISSTVGKGRSHSHSLGKMNVFNVGIIQVESMWNQTVSLEAMSSSRMDR